MQAGPDGKPAQCVKTTDRNTGDAYSHCAGYYNHSPYSRAPIYNLICPNVSDADADACICNQTYMDKLPNCHKYKYFENSYFDVVEKQGSLCGKSGSPNATEIWKYDNSDELVRHLSTTMSCKCGTVTYKGVDYCVCTDAKGTAIGAPVACFSNNPCSKVTCYDKQ